jgi:hypothetical protein
MSRRGLWIAPVCCALLAAGCSWPLGVRSRQAVLAKPAPRPSLDLRTRTAAALLAACGFQEVVIARINATSGAERLAPRVRGAARGCRRSTLALRGDSVRGFEPAARAARHAALLYARAYTASAAALDAADVAQARRARRLVRRADAAEKVAIRLINRRRAKAGLRPVDPLKELFSHLPAR